MRKNAGVGLSGDNLSRLHTYGTPEMAREFPRLYHETDFADSGVAVMAGHEEGIVAFGADTGQAAERILASTST